MAYQWMPQITVFQIFHLLLHLTKAYTELIFRVTAATNTSSLILQAYSPFFLSPFPPASSISSYFSSFRKQYHTCYKAVEIQKKSIKKEDQWKDPQSHPKRREEILNISVVDYYVQRGKWEIIYVKEKAYIEEAIEKVEKNMSNNLDKWIWICFLWLPWTWCYLWKPGAQQLQCND